MVILLVSTDPKEPHKSLPRPQASLLGGAMRARGVVGMLPTKREMAVRVSYRLKIFEVKIGCTKESRSLIIL